MFTEFLFSAGLSLCSREYPYRVHETPSNGSATLIGDSYGVGLSSEFKGLSRAAGLTPYVHAEEGSTTRDWLGRVDKIISKERPIIVFISLGTNDSGTSLEWLSRNRENYALIVSKFREAGARVVWISPPVIEEKRLKNVSVVRDAIDEATYEDEVFDSTRLNIERASDRIHSTPKGYSQWMKKVWEWAFSD